MLMTKPVSEEHIMKSFFQIEKNFSLLELKYKGVPVYPMIRTTLYFEITKQLKILDPPQVAQNNNILKKVISYIGHAIRYNPLVLRKKYDVLVLEHPRKTKVDGELKEIYTQDLCEKISHNFCILKLPYYGSYPAEFNEQRKNVIYYDYYLLKRKIQIWFHRNNKDLKQIAQQIQKAFSTIGVGDLQIENYAFQRILNSYYGLLAARRFLKKISPKVMIIVNAYGLNEFTLAGNEQGIATIEMQHSIMSDTHPGYNYPDSPLNSVSVFPQYIFSFGTYWKNSADFPIPKENILPVGFAHFEYKKSKITPKKERQGILVVSQKSIETPISLFGLEIAKKYPEHTIYFKLHPKQYQTWKVDLPHLHENIPENFKVVQDVDLYELFASCICQAGVFSTAAYEGVGCGIKTIILKLTGWQYMNRLIDSGIVDLVSNMDEFDVAFKKARDVEMDCEQVFRSNAIQHQLQALSEILEKQKAKPA